MPDTNFAAQGNCGNFKEAVCINAGRVYDSCTDKDCIDHLRVYFPDTAQPRIEEATSVKCRGVQVIDVMMDVEPVPFNKGFYSVDMTFYFAVQLDVFQMPCLTPTAVDGLAVFTKKVILYGSEGNVSTFTSDQGCSCGSSCSYGKEAVPRAAVQVVQPICLSCKLMECCPPRECGISVPISVAGKFDGCFCQAETSRIVEVTLGMFSIVSLERAVQMMIPVYEFSIPDKECIQTNDDPCEMFKRIKFPVNEFFPPRLRDDGCGMEAEDPCGCGQE